MPDGPPRPADEAAGGPETDPVVIVAMACRYPGRIDSPDDLWRALADGRDTVAPLPADRGWDLGALHDAAAGRPATACGDRGSFLDDVAAFDADFFGLSPAQAQQADPQRRLMLEISWEAFERAGLDPAELRGSATGVFVGAAASGYGAGGPAAGAADPGGQAPTDADGSALSARLGAAFGLDGPAVTVGSAGSSSLVALHLAEQALRAGECTLALAGGVHVHATPDRFLRAGRHGGLAPDGRSKAFSAAADGTGLGEGAGVLLLERLSAARLHGHPVLAVLRGSAVHEGGAAGPDAAIAPPAPEDSPDGAAQQHVIRAALAGAGLRPDEVDAVQAHGAGTPVGDRTEAEALIGAYGRDRPAERPLWLGSVTPALGDTQEAAGVAGVLTMVLALRHGTLPRTPHAAEPAPQVGRTASVRLLTEDVPWPGGERPRRAAVSALGTGTGTAHLILEEAPAPALPDSVPAPGATELPVLPWPVSARSATALAEQARQLADFVSAHGELDARDLSWSLATTRSALEHRAVVVGTGRDDLLAGLAALAAGRAKAGTVTGTSGAAGRLGFVFTGQGAQRTGMGLGLHPVFPAFADAFDAACAALDKHLDLPLAAVVRGAAVEDGAAVLDDTQWAQAALFAVEVALFRLLESWGVRPDAVAGHSIGELAAAHVAGVWSLDDAAAVVAARGRLMQALPRSGAMVAVATSESAATAVLARHPGAAVAAVNGPQAVVLSGDEAAVTAAAAELAATGVRTHRLRVSHAFHSPLMEPMLAAFAEVTAGVAPHEPHIPLVSALTGRRAADEVTDPDYWVRHVREPVRFADAANALRAAGVRTFAEVGPDGVLSTMGPLTLPAPDGGPARGGQAGDEMWLPALRRGRDEPKTLLTMLARLHARGVPVRWSAVLCGAGGHRVDLPTYPFQRRRYWLNRVTPPTGTAAAAPNGGPAGPAAGPGTGTEARDGAAAVVRLDPAADVV